MPATVLVIAPHPDDETLGCGGYVAQRRDAGDRVAIVVLTRGEKLFTHLLGIDRDPTPDQVAAMRRAESLRATAILGVAAGEVRFLDHPDRSLEERADAVEATLVDLLAELRPAEVLCTGPCEAHPDHVAAAAIARRACARAAPAARLRWYVTTLAAGMTDSTLPYPTERIDIAPQLARKTRAVAQFRAHLAIISPRQTAPIATDFAEYLSGVEVLSR